MAALDYTAALGCPETLSFWAQKNLLAWFAQWSSCPLMLELINGRQSPFMTIFLHQIGPVSDKGVTLVILAQ